MIKLQIEIIQNSIFSRKDLPNHIIGLVTFNVFVNC